jgi:hypothetical protein
MAPLETVWKQKEATVEQPRTIKRMLRHLNRLMKFNFIAEKLFNLRDLFGTQ